MKRRLAGLEVHVLERPFEGPSCCGIGLVAGPWVYRLLISGGKLPEVGPEGLVDLVLSGIASP